MARPGELEFACVCGDLSEKMDQLRRDVLVAMEENDTIVPPDKIEDLSVDLMVYALWNDFYVTVESIHCDQWFGVKTQDFNSKETLYVQCDRIVDGLARIYLHLHSEKKEKSDDS